MSDRGGIRCRVIQRDARGRAEAIAELDADDRLTLNADSFAKKTIKNDGYGNVIEAAYFDAENKSVLDKDEKIARMTLRYDEHGNAIETAYYDTLSHSTLCRHGVAVLRRKYDSRGNQIEVAHLGTDGRPVLRKEGFSIGRYSYDEPHCKNNY